MTGGIPLAQRAALASVATAAFLILLKGYAAAQTGSVAMLGSLADSGLDLVASLVTLWGVRIAAAPADEDHRFGHGKAEALAALFQVALITLSAAAIGWRAVTQFLAGSQPANAEYGIGVSILALAATGLLIAYQRSILRRQNSIAIRADNVHYQSDLLLNGAVIAALVLDQYLGLTGADPVFGVLIALWLGWGAWGSAVTAIDQLMDKEWPEERRQHFLAVAARHPELRGIHDLRTRTSGMRDFVQFHVDVAPDMTIAEAHRVMDEVEERLAREFPGTEILIHPDPQGWVRQRGKAP
ncbi:ferrous-iron efflux pump FieF [Sphingomonas laterariae]|uniref:Ferrous-iron efflux pump FieF n=1 Tax=Edaphosphingomonas laterariae TaxID=861865 RepID=A0A239G5C9_9SPHN|nr:cation diffusion facilitator family transporter [Sphingomonas laterariae]SNS63988.1 ferrous-iron efflux pump FieF [Sphingomonas laterariae]